MDYSDVTRFAYMAATLLSFALVVFLGVSSLNDRWKRPLALAALLQTLWLATLTTSLYNPAAASHPLLGTTPLLLLEATQLMGWIVALLLTLRALRPEQWPRRLLALLLLSSVVYLGLVIDLAFNLSSGNGLLFFAFLALSATALVCLEQLMRNSHSGRFIKLVTVSQGLVFLLDVYLYTQGIVNRSIDPLLWQARAAMIMAASFLIITAGLLFRDSISQPGRIGFSRPVAFYSTSLIIVSTGIMILALGGYYVRTLEGNWGIYAFTLLLFFAGIALSALFLSNHVRSALQVWVSKHFFRHKYDYRQEWINVIHALSSSDSTRVYETVYTVLARTFHATQGTVMALKGNHYHKVFSNLPPITGQPQTVPIHAAFVGVMLEQDWVFAPTASDSALADYNNTLPEWVRNDSSLRLIVPLNAQNQLIGFVTLHKPGEPEDLGWEDLDILKTIGRQLANHILIHTQEEQLSEARQLDTYNKLSAFIMHDLNNLIAQLDLMVKNSERHKSNPAFIDDMILTVGNAVVRMKSLIQKFKRSDYDVVKSISLMDTISETLALCQNTQPIPAFSTKGPDRVIEADQDRLTLALKHLIKNAQEATPEDGEVTVEALSHENGVFTLIIADTGSGMTRAFIEQQLFKPFETTKTGQGMGIGAYLTRSYLEELGAILDVESEPGKGTTFTITFGAAGNPTRSDTALNTDRSAHARSETDHE
ncbi:MAG TPA: XrtA/PEP-CTERM system histidine kinase PrsK [Saccharospirillum sp.]|nr:XrtA/PEP-CTERM system histidine kinase PrsK [Saccharospirillum sp.]